MCNFAYWLFREVLRIKYKNEISGYFTFGWFLKPFDTPRTLHTRHFHISPPNSDVAHTHRLPYNRNKEDEHVLTNCACVLTSLWRGRELEDLFLAISYSFNSVHWRHTLTRWAHLIITRVSLLRWRVYPLDQNLISIGVRIYCGFVAILIPDSFKGLFSLRYTPL